MPYPRVTPRQEHFSIVSFAGKNSAPRCRRSWTLSDSVCPFYVLANNSLCEKGHIVITTSQPGDSNAKACIVGLCLSDNNCDVGTELTLERSSSTFKTHDIGAYDKPMFYADSTDSFVAIDGNLLGMPMGSFFHVRTGDKDPNMGYLFDKSMRLMGLSLVVQGAQTTVTHDRKRRSVLKRVEVTLDGETKQDVDCGEHHAGDRCVARQDEPGSRENLRSGSSCLVL